MAPDPKEAVRRLQNEFLASLNHEIRTPVSGILGMMDLLQETALNQDQQEYVRAARQCAEELLRHLNTALEYSTISAGQATLRESEFNLPECIRTAIAPYLARAGTKGLATTVEIAEDLPGLVLGDPGRLRDVLAHLLDNAVKFTERGLIRVHAEGSAVSRTGAEVRITVCDTGIGIPADQLQSIFDSLHDGEMGLSRRFTGLGLGLALVQRLVRMMGGDITVESEVGQGATFRIKLPVRLPDRREPEKADRGGRVLVVEDNAIGVRVIAHVLRRAGYDVETAFSGEAAIATAMNTRFDIVFMDLEMPGMSGTDAARAIRALPGYDDVPVVALTAHTGSEYRSGCLAAGMEGFLSKPVRPENLLGTVRRMIRHTADSPPQAQPGS